MLGASLKRILIAATVISCSTMGTCGRVFAQTTPIQEEVPGPPENVKYPNGISEMNHSGKDSEKFPLPPELDLRQDPTVRIGPGVVVGPGVYVRGKPMPNPLLKEVLPPNHPLLINE